MAKRDFLIGATTLGNGYMVFNNENVTVGNVNSTSAGTVIGALTVGSNTAATSNVWVAPLPFLLPGQSPGGALRVNGGGYIRGNLVIGSGVSFNNYPPANVTLCTYFNNTTTDATGAAQIGVGDFFVSTGNNTTQTFRVPFMGTAVNPPILVCGTLGAGGVRVPNGTYKCLGSHTDLGAGLFKRVA